MTKRCVELAYPNVPYLRVLTYISGRVSAIPIGVNKTNSPAIGQDRFWTINAIKRDVAG